MTPHRFRQRIATYDEAKQQEKELYDRMESGEFGLFDVITAKILRHEFVADIRDKVDSAWREFGLDESAQIEGKDWYECEKCGVGCFI
jgi:hypothetical protein